jgi:hypothetical protein
MSRELEKRIAICYMRVATLSLGLKIRRMRTDTLTKFQIRHPRICGRETKQRVKSSVDDSAWAKSARPALSGPARRGPHDYPAAPISRSRGPAAKQKRRVRRSRRRLEGRSRARLITLGPLPRIMKAHGPRNTSSCRRGSLPLVQPDAAAARDEKTRGSGRDGGGRRFCFYLICPGRGVRRDGGRGRGRGGDEGRKEEETVVSAAISRDPPGYSIPTESCTVIDA